MSLIATVDPERLTERVRELVRGGRLRAARPLLAALRQALPALRTLDELEAQLLLREGLVADALAILDRALDATPGTVALRLCRAEARMLSGNLQGAAGDAAEAVILDAGMARAKAMLGVVLIELGRNAEAIACLAEAAAQEPHNPAFRVALAEAQERAGDPDAATATLQEAIDQAPREVRLRVAAITVAMRQRRFARAIDLAEAARVAGVADATVFGLLGLALSTTGLHDAARTAYGEALKLAPENRSIRNLVQSPSDALGGAAVWLS